MTHTPPMVFAKSVIQLPTIATTASDDWRAVVTLSGEFDLANSDDIRSTLEDHWRVGRCVIRIDAERVSFMDSTAIGEMVTASEHCRERNGSLILTNVSPRLQRTIELAGLDQVLLVDTASHHGAPRDRTDMADVS